MFKLKHQAKLVSDHEKLHSVSASTLAAIADIGHQPQPQTQTTLDVNTHIQKPSNSQFPISSDARFLIALIIKCKNITQIKQVHAQVTTIGMLHNVNVANKLLHIYSQHKDLAYAYALFGRMKEKDPVSWSVMIGGFSKAGDFMQCFATFRELIRNGEKADSFTLPFVIKGCRNELGLKMGRLVHGLVLKSGLHSDCFICAALVEMYTKFGMIEGAKDLFDKMPDRDLVTWTAMIKGHAECGNPKESLVLFDQMTKEGVLPDKVAMVTIANASAKLGAMNKARLVHDYICRNNFRLDVILGTALIDMYTKCGGVDLAREVFDSMQQRNVISWSAMIAGYGCHGQGKKALDLLPMMCSSGISPNNITFLSLLYACSHSGLVDDGLRLFSLMRDKYGVKADVKHYTCMVDLLGRAGRLNEAVKMIEDMKVEKDEGIWCALLGACRIHRRIDLVEKAAKSLLELQPQYSGYYILLSNIYANAGRWKDVAKIRDLMTRRRVKKIPAYTWIEVDDVIYQFGVADTNHPRLREISEMLKSLIQKLELAGYVPDTNFVLHDVDEEVKLGMLSTHSEKLAIAFGLIATTEGTPIRISKNLRVCGDCHTFSKLVSTVTGREIVVRDSNRFHHFKEGTCSCGDYW